MKYFTYDELKEIRGDVLRKHSLFMTQDWEEKTDGGVECQGTVFIPQLANLIACFVKSVQSKTLRNLCLYDSMNLSCCSWAPYCCGFCVKNDLRSVWHNCVILVWYKVMYSTSDTSRIGNHVTPQAPWSEQNVKTVG